MKKFLIYLLISSCAVPLVVTTTGCKTQSSEVKVTQTIEVVGLTAKAGIDTAARLYRSGQITKTQWDVVAAFYNNKFQPAYNLALAVASTGQAGTASPELIELGAQFAKLVSDLTTK